MKQGDLVRLDPELYIREKNDIGVLVEKAPPRNGVQWIVMIRGRVHPYYIDQKDMVLVNGGCA